MIKLIREAIKIIKKILIKLFGSKKQSSHANTESSNDINNCLEDYTGAYQKRYILTRNEWQEYKKLKTYAAEKGLQICPKVRVGDIIEPRKDRKDYMTLFNKIKAKHIDFVICDQNLRIRAILEIDDNSHNSQTRKDRDFFLDTILKSVGYKVIRTKAITENTLKDI